MTTLITYPRVTQILSATKYPSSNHSLSFNHSNHSLKGEIARQKGTNFHQAIQTYLTSGNVPEFESKQESDRWQIALPELERIKHNYLCLETEVWSDKYQYAGRLDCLTWDSNNSPSSNHSLSFNHSNHSLILIDWKTSAFLRKKSYIEDYFLQGAAYSLAAYECGVAPQIPSEIRIILFAPKKFQIFKKILEFQLVLSWLKRLENFKQMR